MRDDPSQLNELLVELSREKVPFWLHPRLPPGRYPSANVPSLVSVRVAVELVFDCAQVALDEGSPTSQRGFPEHFEKARVPLENIVRDWLGRLLGEWIRSPHNPEDPVLLIEYLRRCCCEFYDKTIAYSTLTCFVEALCGLLEDVLLREGAGGDDARLLNLITGLLRVILIDASLFQAVNRASSRDVAIESMRAINAIDQLQQLHGQSPVSKGWRQELRSRLRCEADVLRDVYEGLREAADALARYEASSLLPAVSETPGVATHLVGERHSGEKKSVAAVREDLVLAQTRVERRIERLLERRELPWLLTYVSRLRPWAEVLAALTDALEQEYMEPLFTEVRLTYCFPFAVASDFSFVDTINPLRRLADSNVWQYWEDGSEGPQRELVDRMHAFTGTASAPPSLQPRPLTGLWQNIGDFRYGGVRIDLPDLTDTHTAANDPPNRWKVWIDLSRLGNHCLCIEQTLTEPTPTEVYAALRVSAYYARGQEFRYALEQPDCSEIKETRKRWRSVADFAHDAIRAVVPPDRESSECPGDQKYAPPYQVQSQPHLIGIVTTAVPLGKQGATISTTLAVQHGGRLFRVNADRVASTLAEWLRYQLLDNISPLDFGFREDWVARLDNATFFGVVGSPSWLTDSYAEVAQFAASWGPLMQMLNRWMTWTLGPEKSRSMQSHELRGLERELRRETLILESDDLCWSHTHRRFVDESLLAVGVTSKLRQLEQQLDSVELLVREQEREAQEASDKQRNRVLATLAVLGVLSLTGAFGVLDRASRPYRGTFVVTLELLILSVCLVLVGGWVLWSIGAIKWNPFEKISRWVRKCRSPKGHL